jgi:hypothetical protein
MRRASVPTCLLLIACCLGIVAAPAQAKQPPPPLYWGAQIGDQLTGEAAPWDMNALSVFQKIARKPLSLVSFSAPFAECSGSDCTFINFPLTPIENARNYGAIPLFSWSSSSTPETGPQRPWKLSNIVNGSLDPYIRQFAEAAKAWGHPFFLRFDWEMNGFWFPWSEGVNGNKKGEFVPAWRHIHDIFQSVGATNATWVWCPNVDFTRKLIPLNKIYPGDKYVDWTCLDGFNWGKRSDSAGWQSFNEVFHETYKRVRKLAPHKPMLIGEIASNEIGGSKPAWIKNMLREIPRYRGIRGLVWFDVKDRNTHWPLESSKEAQNAFANGIRKSVYRPNEFGGLETDGPIAPPSWP